MNNNKKKDPLLEVPKKFDQNNRRGWNLSDLKKAIYTDTFPIAPELSKSKFK
jgi:hypothetical protein